MNSNANKNKVPVPAKPPHESAKMKERRAQQQALRDLLNQL